LLGLVVRLIGSLVVVVWGVAHIVPVRRITRGFGSLSPENRRIVSSTWIAEGLALIFVGAIEGLVTTYGILGGGLENRIALASGGFLLALALLDLATKARSAHLAMRLCPIVLILVAGAFIASTVVPG
jgi:hypothetical protein